MHYFNNFFPYYAINSIFFIFVVIQILLAVFVYKDSKKRGMEPILWTLIVFLVPNFIGLIIYLVVRNTHKTNPYMNNLKCRNCGTPIQKNWKVCPNCMTKLDNTDSIINKETMQYSSKQTSTPKYTTNTHYNTSRKSKYNDFYEDGNKDNKVIIIIIIVAVVAAIGFFILNFAPTRFINNSNTHIFSEQNESSHHINKSFSCWDGTEEKKINIEKDGNLVIDYDLNCDKGLLYAALKDDNNKLVQTFSPNENGSLVIEVKEEEEYFLICKGEKAKGRFSFEFNVN